MIVKPTANDFRTSNIKALRNSTDRAIDVGFWPGTVIHTLTELEVRCLTIGGTGRGIEHLTKAIAKDS